MMILHVVGAEVGRNGLAEDRAQLAVCRQGDEIHLVHVVPKLQMGACFGAPPVDFLPQQDPIAYDQLVKQAETFIQTRFLPGLHSLRVHPIVHIVKVQAVPKSVRPAKGSTDGSWGCCVGPIASLSAT